MNNSTEATLAQVTLTIEDTMLGVVLTLHPTPKDDEDITPAQKYALDAFGAAEQSAYDDGGTLLPTIFADPRTMIRRIGLHEDDTQSSDSLV